jgi:hypothetical protein
MNAGIVLSIGHDHFLLLSVWFIMHILHSVPLTSAAEKALLNKLINKLTCKTLEDKIVGTEKTLSR